MVLCMSVRPFFLKHGRGLSDSLLDKERGTKGVRLVTKYPSRRGYRG